mmetsp:Transcript_11498/g.40952  ORF Transcript_11498/g.40952 Transcript_11498/m.40952 type:complete len:354 (-) Transcript_11498:30-1091(-)
MHRAGREEGPVGGPGPGVLQAARRVGGAQPPNADTTAAKIRDYIAAAAVPPLAASVSPAPAAAPALLGWAGGRQWGQSAPRSPQASPAPSSPRQPRWSAPPRFSTDSTSGSPAPRPFQPRTGRLSQRAQSPTWARARSPEHPDCCSNSMAAEVSVATEEDPLERLVRKGLLSTEPLAQGDDRLDDLAHVNAVFSAHLRDVRILAVYRVENKAMESMYRAIRGIMGDPPELQLWHGTTPDCIHNIVVSGFNRAYSGRHGTKLGHGTYFSANAAYSLRFCGRRPGARRVMLLSKVLVGACAKGSPEMVEPPFKDQEQMARYDTTVDDTLAPSTFCVFRDYQAMPQYVVEFMATDV